MSTATQGPQLSRSQSNKRPSLKIHRFTSNARIARRLKTGSHTTPGYYYSRTNHDVPNATHGKTKQDVTQQGIEPPIDKSSREYLDSLIAELFGRLLTQNSSSAGNSSTKIGDVLPALTSSNEVDLQLHALIGLILHNFVLTWYDRITDDYSNEFLIEIIFTLAHVTRNLEERLRTIDYESLLFDDLFIVCDLHLQSYMKLKSITGSGLVSFQQSSTSQDKQKRKEDEEALFDLLQPHVAIKNQQLYLTKMSENLLSRCLPYDIIQSELTYSILVTIVTEFGLTLVVEKLSETYLIWEIIGKVCDAISAEADAEADPAPDTVVAPKPRTSFSDVIRLFSHAIAYTTSLVASTTTSITQQSQSQSARDTKTKTKARAVLSYHIFSFLNNIFNFIFTFPILSTICTILFKFLNHNTKLNHIMHNLIQNLLHRSLCNDLFIIKILQISREMLFPDDKQFYLAPRFIPTTDEEMMDLQNETKQKLMKVLCKKYKAVQVLLAYSDPEKLVLEGKIDDFLQGFKSKHINKHLIVLILDVLFLRLFPDMAADQDQDQEQGEGAGAGLKAD